jgi:hypothetical protein
MLSSYRRGPSSAPGLVSGICGGQGATGIRLLRVFRFLTCPYLSTNAPVPISPVSTTLVSATDGVLLVKREALDNRSPVPGVHPCVCVPWEAPFSWYHVPVNSTEA